MKTFNQCVAENFSGFLLPLEMMAFEVSTLPGNSTDSLAYIYLDKTQPKPVALNITTKEPGPKEDKNYLVDCQGMTLGDIMEQ